MGRVRALARRNGSFPGRCRVAATLAAPPLRAPPPETETGERAAAFRPETATRRQARHPMGPHPSPHDPSPARRGRPRRLRRCTPQRELAIPSDCEKTLYSFPESGLADVATGVRKVRRVVEFDVRVPPLMGSAHALSVEGLDVPTGQLEVLPRHGGRVSRSIRAAPNPKPETHGRYGEVRAWMCCRRGFAPAARPQGVAARSSPPARAAPRRGGTADPKVTP